MLTVTLTFAGALALVNLWLAFRIIQVRRASGVMTGDGGHPLLVRRMRAQANFAEYVPLTLILMALIELTGGSVTGLRTAGAAIVIARVLHPFGMDSGEGNPARAIGIGLTWVTLLGLAGWAIWLGAHGAAPEAVTR